MKRIALKQFRVGLDLTQEEMAYRMGVERTRYSGIENGYREGSMDFWQKLQQAFNVPACDMWQLMEKQKGGQA